jgi:hypothetical protein
MLKLIETYENHLWKVVREYAEGYLTAWNSAPLSLFLKGREKGLEKNFKMFHGFS